MTDLALPQQYPSEFNTPAEGSIQAWVQDFTALASIAGQLAGTVFIPASLRVYRGSAFDAAATAAQVTAAILAGGELGFDRMTSLRSIHIINGTPALSAIAMRGLLQAHGHDIWLDEATNYRATVSGQRKGSGHVQSVTWSMDDAKARGLAGGRNPNWRTQPRNMLIARATGEVARLVAADALMGMPYTVEELQDEAALELSPPAAELGPRRAKRERGPRRSLAAAENGPEAAAQPHDEPPLDEPTDRAAKFNSDDRSAAGDGGWSTRLEPDEPPLDDEPAPPPEQEQQAAAGPLTDAQRKAIHAALSEQNILARDDRLSFMGTTIGREVASTNDLTVTEASQIIDKLRSYPPVQ